MSEIDTPELPSAHLDQLRGTEQTGRLPSAEKETASMYDVVFAGGSGSDAWSGKIILSLDGGYIHELWSLLAIQHLMAHIKDIETRGPSTATAAENSAWEHVNSSFAPYNEPLHMPDPGRAYWNDGVTDGVFLPCHYFDYICGSSAGSLIAIMLSRFRMSADDCVEEYKNLGTRVFGHPRKFHQQFWLTRWLHRPKYNAEDLRTIIQEVTQRRSEDKYGESSEEPVLASEEGICQTFALAYKKAESANNSSHEAALLDVPFIFRSYDRYARNFVSNLPYRFRMRNQGPAHRHTIPQVVRATTASPLYFDHLEIKSKHNSLEKRRATDNTTGSSSQAIRGSPLVFVDNGFGSSSNPAVEAYYEVLGQHGCNEEAIGTFVSVGTARGRYDRLGKGQINQVETGITMNTDPEDVHASMLELSQEKKFPYYRLNQAGALSDLEADAWKPRSSGQETIDRIERYFGNYIRDPQVSEMFRRCALGLALHRRRRTEDASRWERFALVSDFDCNIQDCKSDASQQWKSQARFRDHLEEAHSIRDKLAQDKIIKEQRNTWKYKSPFGAS